MHREVHSGESSLISLWQVKTEQRFALSSKSLTNYRHSPRLMSWSDWFLLADNSSVRSHLRVHGQPKVGSQLGLELVGPPHLGEFMAGSSGLWSVRSDWVAEICLRKNTSLVAICGERTRESKKNHKARIIEKRPPGKLAHLEVKTQYCTYRKKTDMSFESDTSSLLLWIEHSLWCGLPGEVVSEPLNQTHTSVMQVTSCSWCSEWNRASRLIGPQKPWTDNFGLKNIPCCDTQPSSPNSPT